jgi:hypothetical protein
MPAPYRGERAYPGQEYLLRHAAENNQIIICRCNLCQKLVRFLATDLITMLNPERDALEPPFVCSGCGKTEYIYVKLTSALPGDVGHLMIRRPGPVRVIRTWRWVKLGDE